MLIVIDPGHGGKDPGAVGNGLQEKQLNWTVANLVKDKLAKYDVKVIISQPSCTNPNSNKNTELSGPVNEAIRLGADYYLSIHTNAGGGTGFESFVHNGASRATDLMRNIIHDNTSPVFTKNNMPDRGKKRANFYVLRKMQEKGIPAMLIENGFIDTKKDADKLKDSAFLNKLANEIAYGMVLAFNLEKKSGVA